MSVKKNVEVPAPESPLMGQVLSLRSKRGDNVTDDRLLEFVRILARKAARDYHRALLIPDNDNVEGE